MIHLSIYFLVLIIPVPAFARIQNYLYGIPRGFNPDASHQAEIELPTVITNASSGETSNSITPAVPGSPVSAEPCAVISSILAGLPTGARKIVPAELGLQCLQSVPIDTANNVQLIEELKLYVAWQSNLAYLKNPPADYTEAPVDLIEEMGTIQNRLQSGFYKNEYEFQMDLSSLFNKAYDNHLSWQPDILAAAMQFQTAPGTELVSVSQDARELPQVFTYRDIQSVQQDPSFQPSPVQTINGRNVGEYLFDVARQAGFHDADARWNALFPNQAITSTGVSFLGSFRAGLYQGSNTTLAFANGTESTTMNVAAVFGNFTGIENGRNFAERFCQGLPVTPGISPTATSSAGDNSPAPSPIGYPNPVLVHPNISLSGYFMDADYGDIAVLCIPSYDSPDVKIFQDLLREFIARCKENGKSKLVIDLRGNGGGNAILGYDTFKQLFPQAEPFGGTRFRAHDALEDVGRMTEEFAAGRTYAQSNRTAFVEYFADMTENDVILFTSPFNFNLQLDVDQLDFASWDGMYGPEQSNGDQHTRTTRYNFSDEASYAQPGFYISGHGSLAQDAAAEQPFQSGNIIMLHDGMCSSTCAILSELLKNQGGVRSIVVGGQARTGPMQAIGGTKGAQSFEWDDIRIRTQMAFFLGSPEQQAQWNQTALGRTAFATQIFKRSAYFGDRPAGGINLRDNLRKDDPSQTPLEFIYEAADCRMFYTAEMINDVTNVWKGAVDRMFKGEQGMKLCVDGSTGHKSSVTGGGQWRSGEVPAEPKERGRQGAAGRISSPLVLSAVVGVMVSLCL
ncbi:uncharacterized protein EI97DRAFT_297377 [Westerdykella ornata]|uniref:Uncharacterized protein n=1 Tax=Westerdykella ornata TaxID=318751 RepID=A0A6A6JMV3_WESOR|nr:uncharacterized protein EI97DRAFT_297377 [Westerdykella ornata]KAF2277555.1 hypothetical protein EI97DRAFT_297377 [Westerdykella ornata]